jgi:hypothetical protein
MEFTERCPIEECLSSDFFLYVYFICILWFKEKPRPLIRKLWFLENPVCLRKLQTEALLGTVITLHCLLTLYTNYISLCALYDVC